MNYEQHKEMLESLKNPKKVVDLMKDKGMSFNEAIELVQIEELADEINEKRAMKEEDVSPLTCMLNYLNDVCENVDDKELKKEMRAVEHELVSRFVRLSKYYDV